MLPPGCSVMLESGAGLHENGATQIIISAMNSLVSESKALRISARYLVLSTALPVSGDRKRIGIRETEISAALPGTSVFVPWIVNMISGIGAMRVEIPSVKMTGTEIQGSDTSLAPIVVDPSKTSFWKPVLLLAPSPRGA